RRGGRSRRPSWLHHLQSMPVGVTHRDAAGEAQLVPGYGHRARLPELLERVVVRDQPGLPVDEVVRTLVGRERPAVTRAQVFQELDARPRRGTQPRDAEVRAEDGAQALLLGAVVLALAGHAKAEPALVEGKARAGVADRDRGVIDAEED